jgi:peptide-methionine (S)-S-oxide reductase
MNLETITLGMGCFWCTEAIFQRIKGVASVTSGYSGGTTQNPTYEEVCIGETGHAEVSQIKFNPQEISLEDILYIFFKMHDPTTPNRQGADVGTQYRSVIFYSNETQKEVSEKVLSEFQKTIENKIVTGILPLINFYKAENYHQNYYNLNSQAPYCMFVIDKKIEKLRKDFGLK